MNEISERVLGPGSWVLRPHLSGIALPLSYRSVKHLGLKCEFSRLRVVQEIGDTSGD